MDGYDEFYQSQLGTRYETTRIERFPQYVEWRATKSKCLVFW
jgi:hypothetical protein